MLFCCNFSKTVGVKRSEPSNFENFDLGQKGIITCLGTFLQLFFGRLTSTFLHLGPTLRYGKIKSFLNIFLAIPKDQIQKIFVQIRFAKFFGFGTRSQSSPDEGVYGRLQAEAGVFVCLYCFTRRFSHLTWESMAGYRPRQVRNLNIGAGDDNDDNDDNDEDDKRGHWPRQVRNLHFKFTSLNI